MEAKSMGRRPEIGSSRPYERRRRFTIMDAGILTIAIGIAIAWAKGTVTHSMVRATLRRPASGWLCASGLGRLPDLMMIFVLPFLAVLTPAILLLRFRG